MRLTKPPRSSTLGSSDDQEPEDDIGLAHERGPILGQIEIPGALGTFNQRKLDRALDAVVTEADLDRALRAAQGKSRRRRVL